MNYRTISDFAKGEITTLGRGKADIHSLLDSQNIRVHKGVAEPRPGQLYITDVVSLGEVINSVYEYSREWLNVGVMTFHREYVFSAGTKMYAWCPGSSDYYHINDDYSLSSDDVWIAEYGDYAYIADGINPLRKYDAINYFTVGIIAPVVAPFLQRGDAVSGIGNQHRRYKYRYVRRSGANVNNPIDIICSPFSPVTDAEPAFASKQMEVLIIASDDPQVTHVEIYCTEAKNSHQELSSQTFYRLDRIPNLNATYVDNIANVSLTHEPASHPPEDTDEDWTAPPAGLSKLLYYKERLYGIDPLNPSEGRYSALGEPEQWPSDNWIEFRKADGDVVTCIAVAGNSLYFFKNRSIWSMTGDPEASPIVQVKAGGERVGGQLELGLGCTAPRSLAPYGDTALIFYSSLYGVYALAGGMLTPLSRNVNDILGLDDASSGVVVVDSDGQPFYILSQPSGDARVCHLPTGVWTRDTNVNVPCFCVDSNGYVIGGEGGKLNRYYHPDYDDDNGVRFECKLRTAWVNLRDGLMDAILRGVDVRAESLRDNVAVTVYTEGRGNETEQEVFNGTLSLGERAIGIPGIAGRLFSILLTWIGGTVESLALLYMKRMRR